MSINRAGNLALIANRADNSISVLAIDGKQVKLIDTVAIGEQVAHVAFTPDGKRALAAKFPGHKVALLEVDGEKVTYTKRDIVVGLWPYNLDITPDGKLALTADNGNARRLRRQRRHRLGDRPRSEPAARDRQGRRRRRARGPRDQPDRQVRRRDAAARLATTRRPTCSTTATAASSCCKIDGKKVTKTGEVEVGGLPEGAVFSPDGR